MTPTQSDEELKRLVYEALGEASMQWNPRPSGVFNSTECDEIAKRLLESLRRHTKQELEAVKREYFNAARVAVMQVGEKQDHLVDGLMFKYPELEAYEQSKQAQGGG